MPCFPLLKLKAHHASLTAQVIAAPTGSLGDWSRSQVALDFFLCPRSQSVRHSTFSLHHGRSDSLLCWRLHVQLNKMQTLLITTVVKNSQDIGVLQGESEGRSRR